MTPAEHRAAAEELLGLANGDYFNTSREGKAVAAAQVHATLALAPAAAPLSRPKPNLSRQVDVLDVELNTLRIMTSSELSGVVLYHPASDWSTLLDDPAQVRLLADTLTAHADRMEKP